MSLILQAPAPAVETTTILPNPELSDVENQKIEVQVRRSMNNTKRTYVKSSGRHALTYTFSMSKAKALELRAFILAYYRVPIYLTNHKDEKWLVHFTSNPFEFNSAGASQSVEGREYVTIPLNFEGTLV